VAQAARWLAARRCCRFSTHGAMECIQNSGILGHAKVALAMDVYEHANVGDFRQPLSFIADGLL
jgi:hypothetical protein